MIQKKVKEGEIGCSPLRRGPKGNIPELHYKNLCTAFESFVTINQLNGNMRVCSAKKYGSLIFKVVYGDHKGASRTKLLNHMLRDTACNLNKRKSHNNEDRRIRWTNHRNISMWFDNWENDLVELGFASRDPTTGKILIPEDQLGNIGNFDETCLNLDGSTTNRGGRLKALIYDPRFPVVGKATCKSCLTSTLITGSTAAGEAFPPHIQYVTKAKTAETMRLDVDVAEHVPRVIGKFGCVEERTWPVSFGQNEKGGMDEEEFAKYLFNSIVPLFPHAEDKPGHRVLLKVDSGPGRMNLNLLAKLRLLGFVLYPGVPNTTHVTQETDQNYGPFKTQFLSNLDLIVDARLTLKKSLSLQQKFVGLPLFGGVDRDTQYQVEVGAFQKAFVRSKCLAAWKKVGAATPEGVTRACLDNPQVLRNISNDDGDDDSMLMWAIQAANDRAIHALKQAGYAAEYLQATLQRDADSADRPITQPNTLARQQALANARGHGGRFHVTGGMHVTSDDVFISMEMSIRNEERGKVEKDRKIRQQLQATEEKALTLLEQGKPVNSLSVADLDVLLAWHQAPKMKGAKKADKLQQWMAIRANGDPPPAYKR
jgi:hypothetical protein